jgi:hypothetical protein
MKLKLALNSIIYVVVSLITAALFYANTSNQMNVESQCAQEQTIECLTQ